MANAERHESELIVGLEVNIVKDLHETVAAVQDAGYNFAVTYVVNPQLTNVLRAGLSHGHHPKFLARSEDSLANNDWTTLVAAKISHPIDVTIESGQTCSEKALDMEIGYCYYLGVEVVVIPLRGKNCVNLARHLRQMTPAVSHRASQCIWVQVPMTDPKDVGKVFLNNSPQDSAQLNDTECTWGWWNTLRTITKGRKVYLALELTACISRIVMDRWCCEPIHALVIDTSIFVTLENGSPTLPLVLKTFVKKVSNLNEHVHFVITGSNLHGDIKLYKEDLVQLYKTSKLPDVLCLSNSGNSFVQFPIQPIMDTMNLSTYELFEKDVVKYEKYAQAVRQALIDTAPDKELEHLINILIVGVGRGSLADVILLTAEEINRVISIVVYEKNINVHPNLLFLHEKLGWKNRVRIVRSGIENLDSMGKFDIIVSEFMGTVVANELLPESMNKAKRYLKENGIMIPSSCMKYLAPVCSPRLHDAACGLNKSVDISLKGCEIPYVVLLPNPITMAHPLPLVTFNFACEEPVDNKFTVAKFTTPCDYDLHGFLCYSEIVLYKDSQLSIHPDGKLEGFYSLLPLYFPIHVPMYVKKNECVEAHFWRVNNSEGFVWYEWCVANPAVTSIHNPEGGSHRMAIENSVF